MNSTVSRIFLAFFTFSIHRYLFFLYLLIILMERFWKPLQNQIQKIFMRGIEFYIDIKRTIDPLKKGTYFTDYTIHCRNLQNSYKIDTELSIFLDQLEILEETTAEFPVPNLYYSDTDTLHLHYLHNNHEYKVVYYLNGVDRIRIPIYTETEIREGKGTSGVVKAYCIDTQTEEITRIVTQEVRKFAGPLGNFYEDLGLQICPRDLQVIKKDEILVIKDRSFNIHKFQYNDKIWVRELRLPELNDVFHPKEQ